MTAGASDPGIRASQEDAWLVEPRDGAVLCAVSDGMGASVSGRPAADLTIAMLRAAAEASVSEPAVLARAVVDAGEAIWARSEAARRREPGSDPRWLGMRSTVDGALFVRGRAHLVHVGNGRIYRAREGRLERLTMDHTLASAYPRDASAVPKNVVVRVLGMSADVEVDQRVVETTPGDAFLLCSDGLFECLGEHEIEKLLAANVETHTTVRALIAAALAATRSQREENITVVTFPGDNIAVVVHRVGADGV